MENTSLESEKKQMYFFKIQSWAFKIASQAFNSVFIFFSLKYQREMSVIKAHRHSSHVFVNINMRDQTKLKTSAFLV